MEYDETKYKLRWARPEDWRPAMTMIWKTFLKFEGNEYSDEGVKNFFEFITDANLYKAFLLGKYQMIVAVDKDKVIGAGSIRNQNHLSLLFVDEEYHKRGIGRAIMDKLCDYLANEEGEKYMSLKAAPYAVGFYKRIGFDAVAPMEEYSGIKVTPMEKYFM